MTTRDGGNADNAGAVFCSPVHMDEAEVIQHLMPAVAALCVGDLVGCVAPAGYAARQSGIPIDRTAPFAPHIKAHGLNQISGGVGDRFNTALMVAMQIVVGGVDGALGVAIDFGNGHGRIQVASSTIVAVSFAHPHCPSVVE